MLISSPTCTNRLIFGEGLFFIFLFLNMLNMLSEYANQSHNFTNLNFRDVTLLFSIEVIEIEIFLKRNLGKYLTDCFRIS